MERWGGTRLSDALNTQLRTVDARQEGGKGAGKWRDEFMMVSGCRDAEDGLEAGGDVYVPMGIVIQKKDFLQTPSPSP